MKNRDESYWGDTSLKIYEKIKKSGKCTHPVGALIPEKDYSYEWEKLKNRFEKYGVNMNKGGFMFLVRWGNQIMDETCPIAEKLGYQPIGFTDDQVKNYAKSLKELDLNHLVKQSVDLRKEIHDETSSQIRVSISKKIV